MLQREKIGKNEKKIICAAKVDKIFVKFAVNTTTTTTITTATTELIIFTLTFYIVAINHYKCIKSQSLNKFTSCLLFTLLKINKYGVTTTTMITKLKID